MQGLTFNQVSQIQNLVGSEQIAFSHLADDLIDHICCMVEAECASGLSFDDAFTKVRSKIGETRNLKKVEENTLLLIDKKYRNMKTIMKIFALISLITIAVGSVFKMMHWPGAGILLVLGFALLALVFYPAAISVMKREYPIKGGGVLYPVALIGGVALIIGVLFKMQHYPGASYLLFIGFVLFMFVFIPTLLITKSTASLSKNMMLANILGALALIITLAGVCSKFFHWPGASIELFVGAMMLSLGWLPLYTYFSYKESTFVKGGFIYLCTALILFNLFNMLFALNVSREVYRDFVQPAITFNTGTESFKNYNSEKVKSIMADSTADSAMVSQIGVIHTSAGDLINFLREVKITMIAAIDDIPENEASTLSDEYYRLRNKLNFDVPTALLYGIDGSGKDGLGRNLQLKLDAYRTLLLNTASDKAEAAFYSHLLSTSPVANDSESEPVSWVQYHFYNIPDLGVLNTLSAWEYKIVLAENMAINHLTSAEKNQQ